MLIELPPLQWHQMKGNLLFCQALSSASVSEHWLWGDDIPSLLLDSTKSKVSVSLSLVLWRLEDGTTATALSGAS